MTSLAGNSRRRRPRPRHLRGRDRSGLRRRLRRRGARCADRLDRRHGRPRHGDDERRHRARPTGSLRTRTSTTSASPTSRSTRPRRTASCTTRWTRRSSGSGSPASSSSRPPATTASTASRAASPFAPGNDPFVITVGADDIDGTVSTNDDYAAPWSAYGYTLDGFAKPDIAAPGRYMVGPVPAASTLVSSSRRASSPPATCRSPAPRSRLRSSPARPPRSSRSIPTWTPDQVKGALMLTARPAGRRHCRSASARSTSQRRVDAHQRAEPERGLNKFVRPTAPAAQAFDAASWANTATANASWASCSASWANASWATASWNQASWASASWASASLGVGLLGERLAVGRLVGERLLGVGLLVGQRRDRGAVRGGRVPERRRARGVRGRSRDRRSGWHDPLRRFRDARPLKPEPASRPGLTLSGEFANGVRASLERGTLPLSAGRTLQLWLCGPARTRGTERPSAHGVPWSEIDERSFERIWRNRAP